MAERKPKNTSKIEVIAHKNEIEDLLAKGYNYTLVFNKLKAQNKISCKYHAFLKSTKSICENNKKAKQLNKKNKQDNQNNQNEQKQESTPSQKVSFTDGANVSVLIGDIEKKESN